jgi:hypothetical protein
MSPRSGPRNVSDAKRGKRISLPHPSEESIVSLMHARARGPGV